MAASLYQAVVICTRNRPADLRRTLASIVRQPNANALHVLVVDGSDASAHHRNQATVEDVSPRLTVEHLRYPHAPAGTRQRNYGVDRLPSTVRIVHFVDDDVVVCPEYFSHLAGVLETHPEAGGVGGLILTPGGLTPERSSRAKRFFLLSDTQPGRVLPSGHAVQTQVHGSCTAPCRVQWLSSCASSYRRSVFSQVRFDPVVEGPSPRLEDLDFSYRVGRRWSLLVAPGARLVHHRSGVNRREAAAFLREALLRRYWFVEKNIRHPLRKPAFWWAKLGQALALLVSESPEKWDALRGFLQGVCAVWQRDHPLLQNGVMRADRHE